MNVGRGSLAIAFGVYALASSMAHAETRALVVGVSGYPALAESIRLVGPKNDSREVANTLARLGIPVADITVLADGVTGLEDGIAVPGPGTRKAVLDGLDRLAETSAAGDLVVFYFSGHGSQQADLDGDEQGGADEVFLPYDVGHWGAAGIENAIVDDELNVRINAILDKGVDFFGIIDACHSATGFRAVPGDDAKTRRVDPADLGAPEPAVAEEKRGLRMGDVKPAKGRGRAAFFYAAQEGEEALEKTPKGAEPGESYGVFTYNLLQRLNQTPGLTYRTLHQAVVSDIKRGTLAATQTPELEGELLDEPVLRLSGVQVSRQWPIFGGKLQAGQLSGLNRGTIVALYDDPAAPDDAAVARGIVETSGATKSIVTPLPFPCLGPLAADGECTDPIDPITFKKGRFARIVAPGVDLGVALSEPIRIDPADGQDYSQAIAALRSAVSSPALSARMSLRPSGYDIAVALIDGKLAFAPEAGLIDRFGKGTSPRLTLPDNAQAASATVASALNRIARALALQRLGGLADEAKGLGLEPEIRIAKARSGTVQDGACADIDGAHDSAMPAGDEPRLGDCDIVSVAMKNTGRKPVDVTVLLVGADFSITPVWPSGGASNRIEPSEAKTADLLQMIPDGAPASEQRLVFVAVPGVARSHTVFDNLEQEGLRDVPGDDQSQTAAARRLLAIGLNDMTRDATSQPARIEEEMSIDIRPFFEGGANSGG